eukprot:TRINITY_DN673_c0_g1_i15.p2 TRINITY_DN673_c0_g1~~TRINITY_DN673_c0_g1_i15.p2  ORF type:complete len:422 (-),score=43.82 TRINITY_DN673_c0_g1_i15:541-1806(-)
MIVVFRMTVYRFKVEVVLPALFYIFMAQGASVSHRRMLQQQDQCLNSGIFKFIDAGCSTPGARYEIFGGQVADLNKWPYLMSFQMKQSNSADCYFHVCGGALLGPDVVVTAAHCVQQGRWLGSGQFEGSPQQSVSVTKTPYCRHLAGSEGRFNIRYIVVSPEWSQSDLVGDVALLFLDSSLQGPYLNYQNYVNIYDGQEFQIAGYGIIQPSDRNDFAKNVRPAYRANLNSISRDRCIELMAQFNFNAGEEKIDYDRVFCAHNEFADTCSGDSGGPLVLKGNSPSEDSLVGLASWGPRVQCENENESQAPSAFVRVSYYSSWMSDTIGKHSANSNNNNNNQNNDDNNNNNNDNNSDNNNNNEQGTSENGHSSSDSYDSANGGSLQSMNQESASVVGPSILSDQITNSRDFLDGLKDNFSKNG